MTVNADDDDDRSAARLCCFPCARQHCIGRPIGCRHAPNARCLSVPSHTCVKTKKNQSDSFQSVFLLPSTKQHFRPKTDLSGDIRPITSPRCQRRRLCIFSKEREIICENNVRCLRPWNIKSIKAHSSQRFFLQCTSFSILPG